MTKKKAKKRTGAKAKAVRAKAAVTATGVGETAEKKTDEKPHPAEVRKEVAVLVEEAAVKMVQAVIKQGQDGQLANVKYLLEMAGVYPPASVGEGTEEEDSLALTLLHRLNVPTEPVKLEEEEEPVTLGKADEGEA